jgi:Skp family chaperone for outer membrane proteins
MKSKLSFLILAAASLSACATHSKMTAVPMAAPVVAGTVLDSSDQANVRNPSVVQTLSVGPAQDPNNPNMRVDAHNIERVVEPESWNLHPNVPTAINMGPIVAVNDPNRQSEPVTSELVQKIQEENQLLKVTTEQNDAMAKKIAELQDILKSKRMTDQENTDLKARVTELEKDQKALESSLQQTKLSPASGSEQKL